MAGLDRLVEPTTRAEPDASALDLQERRTSGRGAAADGHQVSSRTVTRLLHQIGYSLQADAKLNEGKQHPDRDAQLAYLNEQARQHQAVGDPVLSVDAKKREIDPASVQVLVEDGVVAIKGRVERRSDAITLERVIPRMEGVVDVDAQLTYRFDDTGPQAEWQSLRPAPPW